MPRFPDSLTSERLFDAHIDLETPERHGAAPFGRRSVHIVKGGMFEGPRLNGTFRAGGGDWLLSFAGGYNELDVRASMETADGALIYLSYHGVLKVDDDTIQRVMSGEDVDPASYYFRTTPRFETGDERYGWLNTLVTVGYGCFGPAKVSYRVFAIL